MRIRDERLPWLDDEPASAATTATIAPARHRTGRAMWPWYLLMLLLIAAVGAGAWWLGTRQREAPPPELPVEEPLAIPVSELEQPAAVAGAPEVLPKQPADVTSAPEPPRTVSDDPRSPEREEPAPVAEQVDETETAPTARTGRSVFPADEPAAGAAPLTGPAPVVVYHPQKNRGRVVQLGAFPTRAQAETTWRRVTRRYPYLATKPKMVNTVEVRPLGGGRGTRMYRLQLGTSSQAQSAVICQQLERAGQSCVVVY